MRQRLPASFDTDLWTLGHRLSCVKRDVPQKPAVLS